MLRKTLWLLSRLRQTRSSPVQSSSNGSDTSQTSKPPYHRVYGAFMESAMKDQELKRRMAAKALNIPYDDDMNIQVDNSRRGLGGLAVAGLSALALASGVGAGALLVPLVLNALDRAPAPTTPETRIEREIYDYGVKTKVIPPD